MTEHNAELARHSREQLTVVALARVPDLRDLTIQLIQSGRAEVHLDDSSWPVYLPSGSKQYPAFWTRDAVWIAHSGLIDSDELHSMTYVMAASQQPGWDRYLSHGLVVPAWSIADHVSLSDGAGTFFPGTYETGDDQGSGRYGVLSSQDANYQFIEMGWVFASEAGGAQVLEEEVAGIPIIERMTRAFSAAEHDSATQLAKTTEETWAVAFTDAIRKTGFLLEGSVMRWRAAKRLSALWGKLKDADQAKRFADIAETMSRHIGTTFHREDDDGHDWLVSATELGCQPCVRGTSYALAFGAVAGSLGADLSQTLAESVSLGDVAPDIGTITYHGHVRHLPQGTYWQGEHNVRRDTYQNGGYWSMFAGWCWAALALTDSATVAKTAAKYFDHVSEHRFDLGRNGDDHGAPWEWIHPDGTRVGPKYLAGLTLPYAAVARGFRVV